MSEQIKWQRDGRTIYSLMHHGWRKGEETFKNRVYFYVYADADCTPAEIEEVVAGIYAALTTAAEIAARADARIAELETLLRRIIASADEPGATDTPGGEARIDLALTDEAREILK